MKAMILSRLLAVGCAAIIYGCSSVNSENDNQAVLKADKLGRFHAEQLAATLPSLNDYTVQEALLTVRAKEQQIRAHGLNKAADAYVASFKRHLYEVNDSLARSIF